MNDPKTPSDVTDPGGISRRKFLDGVLWIGGVALVAGIAYPIAKYLVPPEQTEPNPTTVNAGKVDSFASNTGTIFRMGSEPGLLLRLQDGTFRAFSAVCTHLSCTVQYRPDLGEIWCPCHNGKYDLNGINISGPPPRPLTPLSVSVQNGDVFVSREGV
jgi:cytochrome b6-f complex iron-sulfur subunit